MAFLVILIVDKDNNLTIVEVKSSDSYTDLQDMKYESNDRLNWQIQGCMFAFSLDKTKLFTVLIDKSFTEFPEIIDTLIIQKSNLITKHYKRLIDKYVTIVLVPYFQDILNIILSCEEQEDIREKLLQKYKDSYSFSKSLSSYENLKEKSLKPLHTTTVCRKKYNPLFNVIK